ncbi:hypothetical protein BC937DRAFT_86620 [Endogone sp. FLAS-F59071]|nr:hypothetical protein BC937DRAFT_86620 [Endogone sp. FLAS-F59071]|eukprot:RUS19977.1 hypothetical protein BC937DRAFT_86620 [Endogone sp. FLAS-F59071]
MLMEPLEGDRSLDSSNSESELPEGFKIIHNHPNPNFYLLAHLNNVADIRYENFHHIVKVLCHGIFTAPIEDALTRGIRVLDAGCGYGTWCLEMARDYPQSTFVGIDIDDLLPKTDIPQNCTFLKGDTRELPFEDSSFDYIYQRGMILSFTPEDWTRTVAELYRVLRPGGWLEFFEPQFAFERRPHDYNKFYNALLTITEAKGFDITLPLHLLDILPPTLTNVEVDYVSCPVGWKGSIGSTALANFEIIMRSLKPQLGELIDVADYDEFVSKILVEFRAFKSWIKFPYAFGMKPVT